MSRLIFAVDNTILEAQIEVVQAIIDDQSVWLYMTNKLELMAGVLNMLEMLVGSSDIYPEIVLDMRDEHQTHPINIVEDEDES